MVRRAQQQGVVEAGFPAIEKLGSESSFAGENDSDPSFSSRDAFPSAIACSNAAITSAPASSVSSTAIVMRPEPSTERHRKRPRWISFTSRVEAARSALRSCWQRRCTCSAVACCAYSSSCASFRSVATRLSERTFEYDSSPAAKAREIFGRSNSAVATRTFSRAVPTTMPHFMFSHSAQLLNW